MHRPGRGRARLPLVYANFSLVSSHSGMLGRLRADRKADFVKLKCGPDARRDCTSVFRSPPAVRSASVVPATADGNETS